MMIILIMIIIILMVVLMKMMVMVVIYFNFYHDNYDDNYDHDGGYWHLRCSISHPATSVLNPSGLYPSVDGLFIDVNILIFIYQ